MSHHFFLIQQPFDQYSGYTAGASLAMIGGYGQDFKIGQGDLKRVPDHFVKREKIVVRKAINVVLQCIIQCYIRRLNGHGNK